MTRRPKTISIAEDDRARIPFALVGVLLLLSSATIVGYLQARPDPQSNIDPSLALDRSEATTQSAIKDAIVDASDRVAASPVTEPANDGAFEELLGNDSTDEDVVFRRYAALVAYQEIHDRIDGTNETIRDNATARVTLPAIEDEDDAEAAMDRVSFLAGFERSNMENGTVRVTVDDVTYEVYDEGELVTTREEDVTVTVATPLFQLHHRVGVYQDRLEMSMLDGDGFEGLGREFAARTYPIVIGKSMVNYYRGIPSNAPFQQIAPKRQTEVLANHAIYGIQSKTFGTRDPLWDRPMKAGTLCWLAWESYENFERGVGGSNSGNDDGSGSNGGSGSNSGGANSSSSTMLPTPDASWVPNATSGDTSTYEYWCEGAEFLFGDSTGTPGEVPSLNDIVSGSGNDNEMQQEQNASYDLFAAQAYEDVLHGAGEVVEHDEANVDDDDLSDIDEVNNENDPTVGLAEANLDVIVNRTYNISLSVSTDGEGADFDINPSTPSSIDDPENWSHDVDRTDVEDLGEDVEIEETWRDRSDPSNQNPLVFTVDVEDEVKRTEEHTWTEDDGDGEISRNYTDTDTTTLDVEVRGTYAARAAITDAGDFEPHTGDVENLFQGGNGISDDHPVNFDRAPDTTFREVFNRSYAGAESHFLDELDGTASTSSSDIEDAIGDPDTGDGSVLGPDTITSTSRDRLEEFAHDALETGRQRVIDEGPREYDRTDFVTSNPYLDMRQHLEDRREAIVYDGNSDRFTAMPNFLRAEVLHRYHDTAVDYTQIAVEEHDNSSNDLTNEVDGGEDTINEAVDLAQGAVNREAPTYGGSMNTTDLLGDVSFEIRGSPTYLEFDDVDREDVPAIRPPGNGASDLSGADSTEHVPAASCYNNRIGYFGLPLLPWPGSWYVTASSWGIDVEGEYARFEVTANVSEPSRATSLSYVREDKNVSTTIGGVEAEIGNVDPIEVDTWAEFPMVVPAGKAGTGDPAHSGTMNHDEATEEWNFTGPGWDDDEPDAGC